MKTIKKALLLTFIIAIFVCTFSIIANAATYGDLTYEVSGSKVTITDCSTSVTYVTIPSKINGYPVTSIGKYAFKDCIFLKSVDIPNSITSIDGWAFEECYNLTSVYITDVASWCNISFGNALSNPLYYAKNLVTGNGVIVKKLVIPDSVTSIGKYAFYNCTSLTSITIPDSVTSIGDSAFYDCTSLTSVSITDLAKWCHISIGNAYGNPLYYAEKLYINNVLATDITIPDGVTSIGFAAFYNCTSLTSVTIGDSVTSIGKSAFYNCTSLTSITISDSVTNIGDYAFRNCTSLASVTMGDSVTSIGSYAFASTGLTSIIIPDSVTSISNNAFGGCSSLKSVTIGNGVTNICEQVFYNCKNLTQINWNAKNVDDFVEDNYVFAYAGQSGEGLNVVFGDSVEKIPAYAFCPESYDSAYYYSPDPEIVSVTIGENVTRIGAYAFDNCTHIRSVYITDLAKWCQISFGNAYANPLYYDNYLEKLYINNVLTTDITIPDGVTSISGSAFYGCTSITSITIPESVTSIGFAAFYNCNNLTQINWNAKKVADFYSVSNLVFSDVFAFAGKSGEGINVVFGNSVEKIPEYAFCPRSDYSSYAPKIVSVTIGESVRNIGKYAFYNCTKINTVFYNGISEEWIKISIASNNDSLKTANRVYLKKAIRYNANGGSGAPDVQSKQDGNDILLSSVVPERTGYNFLGWSTTSDGEVEYNPGDNYSKNEDVTLYAVWEKITKYTISYDANGGTGAPESQTETYGINSALSSTVPVREGYNFLGWSTNRNYSGETKKSLSVSGLESDHNYSNSMSKTWTISSSGAESIKLTFDSRTAFESSYDFLYIYNASGTQVGKYSGTSLAGKTVTVDGDFVSLKLTSDGSNTKWGFKVTSAYAILDHIYEPGESYTENSDVTFYAVWSEKTYSVTYNSNGGSGAPSSQTKYYFSDLTLRTNIPTKSNYVFVGWSTTANGKVEYLPGDKYTVNETMTLYAKWVKKNGIAFDGVTNAIAGQEITYDVHMSSNYKLDYLISKIKFPKHFTLKEINSKDFVDNTIDAQYSDDEFGYVTIISTYSYEGERTEQYRGYTPYEIVFEVSETCPLGTHTISFSNGTIGVGDADYTFAFGEINVFVPDVITIHGDSEISEATQYTVNCTNSDDVSVLWSVDCEEIATISKDGVLTPLINGTVVITATYTYNDTVFASKTVTIKDNDITAIDIIGADTVYDGAKYYAKLYPENLNHKTVTWSVDNTEVATITEDGVLTAVGVGTVKIKATVNDATAFSKEMTVTIPSINAVIDTLSSDVGTWDKEFVPYERNYTITVPADTASISFTGSFTGGSLKCNTTTMLNGRARSIDLTDDITILTLYRSNVTGKNESSYTVTVVRSAPHITANVSVVNGKYHFEIDIIALPEGYETACVVLAVYDENRTFVTMQTKTVTLDDTTAAFDVEDVYSYQVMLLDSLGNIKPLSTSVKGKI